MISIKNLNKAEVLAALYNASKPLGMGFIHYNPTPMTVEQAEKLLQENTCFDYLQGRVMKIDLSNSELDVSSYNNDIGSGAAEKVIEELQNTKNVNSELVQKMHQDGIKNSANDTIKNMKVEYS